jgi:TonB-dependent receptor
VAAAETNPPAAAGTYREKVDLVTDASVADSLARQKNLSFSSVRIDGETSEMSLSALTADQIENAEATKVPTPDLDADAVGGLLQLTSRPSFLQKGRTLRGSLELSYDPRAPQPGAEGSVTFGRSLGTRQRSGFMATFEHRQRSEAEEEIELDWRPGTARLRKYQFGDAVETGSESNFNGSMDWKLGTAGMAYVRAEGQHSTERDDRHAFVFELPDDAPAGSGDVRDAEVRRSFEDSRRTQQQFTLATGANHDGRTWRFDLRLTHRMERDHRPDERSYEFAEEGVDLTLDHRDAAFPRVFSAAGANPGDRSRQVLDELQVVREDERATDTVGSVDVTRLGNFRGRPAWLKAGLKMRFRHTTSDHGHDIHGPAGEGLRISDVAAVGTKEILGGRYRLDGFPDLGALRQLFATQPGRFALDPDKSRADTDPANFEVRQDVQAAYAMGNLMLAGNRVVAGVRAERTASRFSGREVAFDEDGRYAGTTAVTASRAQTDVFPGLHASRAFTDDLAVYLSWTQSIRRPDYTDLVPARRISRAGREIEEGNADLRSTLYTNYDLSIDFAYDGGGKLSLELFHRDISDPTLNRRSLLTEGPFAGFERSRPENGARASLRGGELAWGQELEVLHPLLEGFELELNYRRFASRQTLESRPGESLPLANQPDHEVAMQLAYDRGPYYVAVELEHEGRSLDSIGRQRAEDRFVPARNTWALSISRQFRPGLRVILDLDNLAGRSDRRYMGDPSRPDFFALDVRTYRLGLKWER